MTFIRISFDLVAIESIGKGFLRSILQFKYNIIYIYIDKEGSFVICVCIIHYKKQIT